MHSIKLVLCDTDKKGFPRVIVGLTIVSAETTVFNSFKVIFNSSIIVSLNKRFLPIKPGIISREHGRKEEEKMSKKVRG